MYCYINVYNLLYKLINYFLKNNITGILIIVFAILLNTVINCYN